MKKLTTVANEDAEKSISEDEETLKENEETDKKKNEIAEEQKRIEESMMEKLDINGIHGDKEKIMDKLLKSVDMVKGILQTNLKLRQQIIEMGRKIDQTNIDFFHVQDENEEIKAKIMILEDINSKKESDGSEFDNRIYLDSELNQLRNDNSILEKQLQSLEKDNINIRISKNTNPHFPKITGADDFEPVRSIIRTEKSSITQANNYNNYFRHTKLDSDCPEPTIAKIPYPNVVIEPSIFPLYLKVSSRA